MTARLCRPTRLIERADHYAALVTTGELTRDEAANRLAAERDGALTVYGAGRWIDQLNREQQGTAS